MAADANPSLGPEFHIAATSSARKLCPRRTRSAAASLRPAAAATSLASTRAAPVLPGTPRTPTRAFLSAGVPLPSLPQQYMLLNPSSSSFDTPRTDRSQGLLQKIERGVETRLRRRHRAA